LGICTLAGANYTILESTITIKNNIKYYDEEKNALNYCVDYATPTSRDVSATCKVYFRPSDTDRFADAMNWVDLALVVPLGSVAGSIVTFTFPTVKVKAPAISGNAERVEDITWMPHATITTYESEVAILYS
jgi:hypothetical protein